MSVMDTRTQQAADEWERTVRAGDWRAALAEGMRPGPLKEWMRACEAVVRQEAVDIMETNDRGGRLLWGRDLPTLPGNPDWSGYEGPMFPEHIAVLCDREELDEVTDHDLRAWTRDCDWQECWWGEEPEPDAWRWELDPSDPEHPNFGRTLEAFEADRIAEFESR